MRPSPKLLLIVFALVLFAMLVFRIRSAFGE